MIGRTDAAMERKAFASAIGVKVPEAFLRGEKLHSETAKIGALERQ